MSKLTLIAAGAAGYVLGTRAGRERYEQIAAGARRVMRNPRVQSAREQAQGLVAEQASAAKDVVVEKAKVTAASAASAAADKVRRGDGGAHSADVNGADANGADANGADQSWPADHAAPPMS